jgi:hypothetical protein
MTAKDMLIKVTPFLLVFRVPIIIGKFYGKTRIFSSISGKTLEIGRVSEGCISTSSCLQQMAQG